MTVVVLVVVSLSLISLDLNGRTHNVTSGVKSVANSIYAPLQQGTLDIVRPIGSFFAGAVNYGALQSENERLQQTIGQLRAAQAERSFENAQLRQLTALENLPFLGSLPTVPAQTIQEYSSNFTATITIDKGRDEGVDVGYPVVGEGGLVGQVIQRFAHTSVVRLITDGQSKVGCDLRQPTHRDRRRPGSRQRPDPGPGAAQHAGAQGREGLHQRARRGGLPAGDPGGHGAEPSTRRRARARRASSSSPWPT